MNEWKFALRQLLKNPGFTAVTVLTLALGIGANTAMFSLVNGVLLKPLPYPDSDRLVSLSENQRGQGQDFVNLTAPGFSDWRTQSTVFEDLAAYQPGGFDLTGTGDPARLSGIRASASLFPLLRVQPELGRGFTEAEDTFGCDRCVGQKHHAGRQQLHHRRRHAGRLSVRGARCRRLAADGVRAVGIGEPGWTQLPGDRPAQTGRDTRSSPGGDEEHHRASFAAVRTVARLERHDAAVSGAARPRLRTSALRPVWRGRLRVADRLFERRQSAARPSLGPGAGVRHPGSVGGGSISHRPPIGSGEPDPGRLGCGRRLVAGTLGVGCRAQARGSGTAPT